MAVHNLAPILYASDFARSMSYFTDKLGFKKLWDWGDPPGFGAVARDKIRNLSLLEWPRATRNVDVGVRR